MAITTRQPRARRLSALAASLLVAFPAAAAEWNVVPSLRTRLSYSDNVHLLPEPLARAETIGEIAPGISISASARRLRFDAAYSVSQVSYSREPSSVTHNLHAGAQAELVEDWLFAGARASISRMAVSPFGPQPVDGAVRGANESSVRVLGITPTLRHRVPGLAALEARFAYEDVSAGARLLRARSGAAAITLASDGLHGWGWDTQYQRKRVDDASVSPVNLTSASGALRYAPTPRLRLSARSGYEDNDYRSIAGPAQGHFWHAALDWNPSRRSSLSVSTGRRYFGKTYGLDLSHRARRSLWQLSYGEDITSTHAQFLALNQLDTSAVLNALWATSIPDAQLRQRQVALFLAAVQVLGPGRGTVNYFSHGYFLQKLLVGSIALQGARNTLVLNAVRETRTAQTSNIIDSELLPPGEATLFDRTRQRSASALWSWRLASRSSLNAAATRKLVTALSSGRTDTNTILRAGLAHQFQPRLGGTLDLRHVRHDSSSGGAYRENAISVSLAMQF
ncbi:MAG: TIGR03016 family PEP-CTERM system-associated outer membrane protein [Pseudomonadota bacterium]